MDQQFSRYSKNCHILIIWAFAMTLTLKLANQAFCIYSSSEWGINYQVWLQNELVSWCFEPSQPQRNVRRFKRYHLDKHWHFDPSLWTWPWMQLSNFFHRTLWLMMMYHQTKFGCQGMNSPEDIAERVIFFITWALAAIKYFITWHSGSWCCTPHRVWLQNVLQSRKYHLHKYSQAFWTFVVTLTLKAVIQFFQRALWFIMLYY